MRKKRQHYVPRFYLKQFARKTKRSFKIRCFDKNEFKKFETAIAQIAMENYFYDKGVPAKTENLFSKKEQEHAQIYNKIIEQGDLGTLTENERFLMAEYIFLQNERTSGARNRYIEVVLKIYEHFEQNENFPKFDKFLKDYKDWFKESRAQEAQKNVMFKEFTDDEGKVHKPEDIINSLLDLKWMILKNNQNMEFYSSDHPIVLYKRPKDGKITPFFGAFQYFSQDIEIFFPLSPRICLILQDKNITEYFQFHNNNTITEEWLDWINTQIIFKAYRTVFSKNNGFQFVRDILKENPEFRDPDRSRLYG